MSVSFVVYTGPGAIQVAKGRVTMRGLLYLLALIEVVVMSTAVILTWKYDQVILPIGLMLFATVIAIQIEIIREALDNEP